MSSLYELACSNPHLKYIDDDSQVYLPLSEIHLYDFNSSDFGAHKPVLIFAYLDNSLKSIQRFWSAINSIGCVALLPANLNPAFKRSLEETYSPHIILDIERVSIEDYVQIIESGIFLRQKVGAVTLHHNIKVLLNTSGTTGSPKFVKLSEDNLLSNALSISAYLPIQSSDVTPLNLPIHYSYGLSILTSNSINGGTIVCSNTDVLNRNFWSKMDFFGYTSLAGVPFVYEMLDRIGFTKKSYKSLRYLTQAGGKLKTELAIKFAEYAQLSDIDFFIMYGATEATARMSYLPPKLLLLKPDSIGKPIPNGFFHIDPSTSELLYKGANVFGGYVDKPEDLSNYDAPDWLKTGDIASKDEDGCYYIKGRLKRFVKLFGNRINLDEVESILNSSLSVQAKCIGVEDKWLAIFYIGTAKIESEVTNYLHKVMQLHPSKLKFISIHEFPYTINGKVNYQELQNKLPEFTTS